MSRERRSYQADGPPNVGKIVLNIRTLRVALRSSLLALCVPAIGCTQPPAQLTVDINDVRQTMAGWEVTARTWEFDKVNDRFDGLPLPSAMPLPQCWSTRQGSTV
ncbi:MAG: hypothetical protein IPO97_08665 [Sphingomonadales bacterium]|nr:hypothetical protein [Sphingomonadales bacterium]